MTSKNWNTRLSELRALTDSLREPRKREDSYSSTGSYSSSRDSGNYGKMG